MALTIILQPDAETRLRDAAAREGVSAEELAARRVLEAELLTRILSYLPAEDTRKMRSLVRKRETGRLTVEDEEHLKRLAHAREVRNVARLEDLLSLARLRGISLREIMQQLNIRPSQMS
jgi:molybdopterin-guanine dinucleotide biosynthesis protein A